MAQGCSFIFTPLPHFSVLLSALQLAEESFPMCMRHSQSALTETHHLKHGARMQYGLFLKVGLGRATAPF